MSVNVANIRVSNQTFVGEVPTSSAFKHFKTDIYAVRALIALLHTYYYKYNCNSISLLISRYAPSSENDTDSYINYVNSKFVYDVPLRFNKDTIFHVCNSICLMETHYILFYATFLKAWNLYFNIKKL